MKNNPRHTAPHSRYRTTLLIYTLIPVIFVTALFLLLDTYLLRKGNEHISRQCYQSLSAASQSYTRELTELSKNTMMMMESNSFREVILSQSPIPATDRWKLSECTVLLQTYVNTKDYICSAGFLSPQDELFIASSGLTSTDLFFSSPKYGNLINSPDYLAQYQPRPCVMQIQPVTTLETANMGCIDIIPLLQYNLGTTTGSSPLIVYFKKEAFSRTLLPYLPTENSILCLSNHATGDIIASTAPEEESAIHNFLTLQDTFPQWYSKDLRIQGISGSFYGFTLSSDSLYSDQLDLLLLVPKTEFLRFSLNSLVISIAILSLCCLLGYLSSRVISLKMYHPISRLARSLERETASGQNPDTPSQINDEMAYLDEHVSSLVTSHKTLEHTINTALPTLHTRYILNILYQEEYDNLQLEPILEKFPFHFPWPYFTCSILHTRFLEPFYQDFDRSEQDIIQQKLTDVLAIPMAGDCSKYVFRMQEMNFCLIYNTKEKEVSELISRDFRQLLEMFSFDSSYVHLYMAVGSTEHGLSSLRDSYRKSRIALSEISVWLDSCCRFYQEPHAEKSHYLLNNTSENTLSAGLIQGNEEVVLALMGEIITANQKEGISEDSLRDLYVNLYQIGKRAADQMNLDYVSLLGDAYISLSGFLNSLNNFQRASYLSLFYQTICQHGAGGGSVHIDTLALKDFIDTHYTEDLYLEMLADKYHTSAKYMSKLLKNILGIPFKQYLSTLRIHRAKELLVETDLKIEEIAQQSGFNGRNTFIRLFKTMEGMTPSDYRKYKGATPDRADD